VPSLSVEMLRLAARAPAVDLTLDAAGMRSVGVGPLRLPTEPDGRLWVDFAPSDPRRFVAAGDVLQGAVAPERLDGRLVLLAVTGLGLQDHFD
ncbi:CHASE2 domain-containing protein, partial [Acinetobacter baumannii]